MDKRVKPVVGKLSTVTALDIIPCGDEYRRRKEASQASERFLYSAALLPGGSFLGWQISADCGGCSVIAFSTRGAGATREDMSWIYEGCASVKKGRPKDDPTDLFQGDRAVYILSPVAGSARETSAEKRRRSYNYGEGRRDEAYFLDMFAMVLQEGGVIQILAGAGKESCAGSAEKEGHGVILISLPGEMTLRLRTLFSLAFPNMAVEKLADSPEHWGRLPRLSDSCLMGGMTRFLDCLMGSEGEAGEKNKEAKEERKLYGEDLEIFDDPGPEPDDKPDDKPDADPPAADLPTSFMDRLDALIGLEDVKAQVRRIAAYAKMKKDMAERGMAGPSIALNMEFVGNPGTAKTTVARILAGIFFEIGLLESEEMVEVGRADLVAKYTGQTADQVRDVFKKAKGKLLFIDEAYSLIDDRDNSYGDEAINTIVQEMENHREETFVIFAGYPNRMKEFFAKNPGLRSRVPFHITFPDYSPEDMMKIVELEAEMRGFSIDSGARPKVISICETAASAADSGNGRFCRNLVENAILGYASRAYGCGTETCGDERNYELTDSDFYAPAACKEEVPAPRKIGFA